MRGVDIENFQPTTWLLSKNLIVEYQHRKEMLEGFSKKYHVQKLVYYEIHSDIYQAILREKQLKKWKRQWKINLIEKKILGGLIWVMSF